MGLQACSAAGRQQHVAWLWSLGQSRGRSCSRNARQLDPIDWPATCLSPLCVYAYAPEHPPEWVCREALAALAACVGSGQLTTLGCVHISSCHAS